MVSVKLKFRPSIVEGKEGSLYYQVIYKRMVRQIPTNYKVLREEWNETTDTLLLPAGDNLRFNHLRTLQLRIQLDKKRFLRIVNRLSETDGAFTIDMLVREYLVRSNEMTLFNYTKNIIEKLKLQGQYRTSETYNAALNSFRKFREGIDLCLEELDSELLLTYEAYLKIKGIAPNTISFYMKKLRAVYNRAVEEELVESRNPFKRVFTSSEKTVKRAISVKYIKRLKELDLSYSKPKCFARDMFLFSFYTRGMSFVDMAYLQKKNLKNDILCYRRKKTGQMLSIHWEPCMRKIAEPYASQLHSPYLLSIIRDSNGDLRKQYRNAQTLINRNLKEIGKIIGLPLPLTMYVARHSWASIARAEGIPVSIISEGMGHDSERTTQIYLASLETRAIDKANKKILKLL